MSCVTPLGARRAGGLPDAAFGSVAHVACCHLSNQPGGIRAARLSSGPPLYQRSFAISALTMRYAPSLAASPVGGASCEIQTGAYSTRRFTFSGCAAAKPPAIV